MYIHILKFKVCILSTSRGRPQCSWAPFEEKCLAATANWDTAPLLRLAKTLKATRQLVLRNPPKSSFACLSWPRGCLAHLHVAGWALDPAPAVSLGFRV